jgi:hypothetical protein
MFTEAELELRLRAFAATDPTISLDCTAMAGSGRPSGPGAAEGEVTFTASVPLEPTSSRPLKMTVDPFWTRNGLPLTVNVGQLTKVSVVNVTCEPVVSQGAEWVAYPVGADPAWAQVSASFTGSVVVQRGVSGVTGTAVQW